MSPSLSPCPGCLGTPARHLPNTPPRPSAPPSRFPPTRRPHPVRGLGDAGASAAPDQPGGGSSASRTRSARNRAPGLRLISAARRDRSAAAGGLVPRPRGRWQPRPGCWAGGAARAGGALFPRSHRPNRQRGRYCGPARARRPPPRGKPRRRGPPRPRAPAPQSPEPAPDHRANRDRRGGARKAKGECCGSAGRAARAAERRARRCSGVPARPTQVRPRPSESRPLGSRHPRGAFASPPGPGAGPRSHAG